MDPDEVGRKQAEGLFQEAFRKQMAGELDEAEELYRRSIAVHPTAEAHTFLGWTMSFAGRVEEAIDECKKAIAVDPDFGNPYNDIGSYLMKLGRLDEAVPWLERAIVAPRYEPRQYPHLNLGRLYWMKGELARAREEFGKALVIRPEDTLAQMSSAALRWRLEGEGASTWAGASGADEVERFDRAITQFQRGFLLQRSGRLGEAIEAYRGSVEAFPTAEGHTFLGWALAGLERTEEAIDECRKAIAVDPDFGNPYNDIGSYLMKLGRPAEAIPWLEQAIRAPRYEPRHYPHVNLGRAYSTLGQLAKAIEEFEKALEIEPDHPLARSSLEELRRKLQ